MIGILSTESCGHASFSFYPYLHIYNQNAHAIAKTRQFLVTKKEIYILSLNNILACRVIEVETKCLKKKEI